MSNELPPIAIELLIWFHTRGELPPNHGSEMVNHWINVFSEWDVIRWWGGQGTFVTTDRGKAWVKLLCRTPPPEVVYVDQNGIPIEDW